MYYVRKANNNTNIEKLKSIVDTADIDADFLKQELGTTGNTLSFWKCDDLDEMSDTIKAIILSSNSIRVAQLFALPHELVEKYGLKMDDAQPGVTGYKGYEHLHIDMIELTYSKIGVVLNMLKEAFQDKQNTPKIEKEMVKEYIREVKGAGLLNEECLQEHLKKDINKYC